MQRTNLEDRLKELAVTGKHKSIEVPFQQWFLQEATRKAAAMNGYPDFETGHYALSNQFGMKETIVFYNFMGNLFNLFAQKIKATELSLKKFQLMYEELYNDAWRAMYFWEFGEQSNGFLRTTELKDTAVYQVSADDVKTETERAISTFKASVKTKKPADKIMACLELYRSLELIKPFVRGNGYMNLLILYQNLQLAGIRPVPFPAKAEQGFPERFNRILMDKDRAQAMLLGEWHEAAGQVLKFCDGMLQNNQKGNKLSGLRKDFPAREVTRPDMPDIEMLREAYRNTIYPLVRLLLNRLAEVNDFFEKFELNCTGQAVGGEVDDSRIIKELRIFLKDPSARYFNINFHWRKLLHGGEQAFGFFLSMQIEKGPEGFYINRHDGSLTSHSLKWGETLTEKQISSIADEMMGQVTGYINRYLKPKK